MSVWPCVCVHVRIHKHSSSSKPRVCCWLSVGASVCTKPLMALSEHFLFSLCLISTSCFILGLIQTQLWPSTEGVGVGWRWLPGWDCGQTLKSSCHIWQTQNFQSFSVFPVKTEFLIGYKVTTSQWSAEHSFLWVPACLMIKQAFLMHQPYVLSYCTL